MITLDQMLEKYGGDSEFIECYDHLKSCATEMYDTLWQQFNWLIEMADTIKVAHLTCPIHLDILIYQRLALDKLLREFATELKENDND